ncbi:ATP synthase F1 subcomplex delta subunit [Seinonella peptonophila]|uniref:ATP synthase subunit delta n=1 Tax=Seinonella peptonophila TaxID=112248 RepID=A0A1M4XTZ6_9BACL|nr:F0F1 ATP synthase subunit delta [Seinonella peptonophila]SHE97074.1 ATP synthase F1 subcomplex delta subunit [Seinonella peptonophila]
MRDLAVANRYAKAFFEIASEQSLIEELESNLKLINDVLKRQPQLAELLIAPSINVTAKKEIIKTTFAQIHSLSQNLLFLLIDRHRIEHLEDIYLYFHQFVLEAHGEVEAIVTSATPLTEEEERQLIEVFVGLINKKLLLTKRVDSELLGGVVVQIDDRVYDGSLRTKLKRFQEQLQHSRVDVG